MTKDKDLDVSRETLDKLQAFETLVTKWTAKINLISKSTVSEIWERHILDSAQIYELANPQGHWVDLGSGGGFPGIVIAILSQGSGAENRVTLVESDQRKAVFLRTAIRELDLKAQVIAERIERIDQQEAQVLSARALTDLDGLLAFSEQHLSSGGTALFPKGAQWEKEHIAAQKRWSYSLEVTKSRSNPAAAILKIKDIKRV